MNTNDKISAMIFGGSVLGFDQSARALEHYRQGSKEDLKMSTDWLRNNVEIQKAETNNQEALTESILSTKKTQDRLSALKNGQSLTVTDQYLNEKINAQGLTDLHFASGRSKLQTQVTLTFTRKDNTFVVDGKTTHHWFDDYNWHNDTSFLGGAITGEQMNALQATGANPFQMIGDWTTTVQTEIPVGTINAPDVTALNWELQPPAPRPTLTKDEVVNRNTNNPKLLSLLTSLYKAKAPDTLLLDIALGSVSKRGAGGLQGSPALGAAIQLGIEGTKVMGNPLQNGLTSLEAIASERARLEYAKSGDPVKAAQAAVAGLREAESYQGASRDTAPEDTQTAAQNQAQLARNTQLLEARRAVTQKANFDKLMNQAKAGLSRSNLLDTKQAQTHRPETLQQRYEGLGMTAANARTAVSNTQQNLSEISGTVESGRYAGPSGEFSPEDFQTEDDIKSFMRTPAYRDRRDPVAVDRVKKGFESLVTRQEQATQAAYERVQTDIDQKNAVRAKVDDKVALAVDKTTKQRRAQAIKKELGPPTLKQFNAQNQMVEEQGLLTKSPTANASLTATSNFSLSRERTDTLQAASSAQQNRMADREKSWSNLSDHGKIDAARGSRRGAARSAKSATPSGTNAYGERTTGEFGSLGRGGQLSSVGGQKANANQKNRAANKDGSYSLDAEGNGAGDAGGTVICTELYHQSFLPLDVFIEDQRYGAWIEKNDPYVMIGYHFLAKPVVRLMQRSPLFTQVLYTTLAKPWAVEMVVKQGGNGFGSVRGKVLFSLGLPICRWIGKMLVPTKKLGVKMATV